MGHQSAAPSPRIPLVPVIAGLAEGHVVVSGIVIPVDALAAVSADHGFLVCTGFAELIIVHQDALTQRMGVPTVAAGKGVFFHSSILLIFGSDPGIPRVIQEDNISLFCREFTKLEMSTTPKWKMPKFAVAA